MSNLLNTLRNDQLMARKNGLKDEAVILTTLIGEASPSGNDTVTDEQVLKKVQVFINNAKEMRESYSKRGNDEKVAEHDREINVLSRYLPVQLTEDDIVKVVEELVETHNLEGMKSMKVIMEHFKDNYFGQYDSKALSSIAREKLK